MPIHLAPPPCATAERSPAVADAGPDPDGAAALLDDEAFDAGLEVFPFLANEVGLVGVDAGVVFDGFGDGFEQFAEVADHAAGFGEDALVERSVAGRGDGVGDEEAAGLVAEPADEADVLRDAVHLAHAVERVLGA